MYVPDHFREDRPEVLQDAVRRIGFATLVTHRAGGQPPADAAGTDGVLRGHVARANPVWKAGDGRGAGDLPGPACLCLAQLVSHQGRNRQGGADLELHHRACAGGNALDSGCGLAAGPCRRA